jgi:antitoxin Phd
VPRKLEATRSANVIVRKLYMAKWQIYQAKSRLSELIRDAEKNGPQIITHRGFEKAVVISPADYRALTLRSISIKDYLLGGPKVDNFEIMRTRSLK